LLQKSAKPTNESSPALQRWEALPKRRGIMGLYGQRDEFLGKQGGWEVVLRRSVMTESKQTKRRS